MSLDFNQTCPILYQPPGFVDKDDFQEGDAQEICDALVAGDEDVVGTMNTGHYQVRVTVRLSNSEAQDSLVDLQDTEMSKQLQTMQKTSSNPSNNLLSTLRESLPPTKRSTDGSIPRGKRAKIQTDQKRPHWEISAAQHGVRTPQSSQSLGEDSNAVDIVSMDVEQSSIDLDMPMNATSKDKLAFLRTSKLAELLVHCYAIQSRRPGHSDLFRRDLLVKGDIQRHKRSRDVNCECGSLNRSSKMVSIPSHASRLRVDRHSFTVKYAITGSMILAMVSTKVLLHLLFLTHTAVTAASCFPKIRVLVSLRCSSFCCERLLIT